MFSWEKEKEVGLRKRKHVSQALRGKLVWQIAQYDKRDWIHIYKEKYMMG